MQQLTDISLVTQVAVSGNRRAFDELVRRYQSPIRRFFLHQTLGDSQLSDDLAQDTFLKAYTHIGSFRGMASFKTWLMRIAYNVFYDYRRKNALVSPLCDPNARVPEVAEGSSRVGSVALQMDIHQALSLLRDEERTCITLQLIDGEPIDHISEITGMPANTVKSHLKRGKEKLTIYLKQNGYD